jgi:hypothetical protein
MTRNHLGMTIHADLVADMLFDTAKSSQSRRHLMTVYREL